ncbi:hypothetical protein RKE29_08295 [Streptomyces sp. B1866]|uniref:hypothetical protein n=1 Tax=Streptomyces sp. B1866 TaxID=3075431 RepID=UPI0028919C8F|nr:hypothetical protein [Streptomyces sp. B1866]MDT3396641.1 hypothetical protein [Streptomyces sp. B1866]
MAMMRIRVYRFNPETGERSEVSSVSYVSKAGSGFAPVSCEWPRCECLRCRMRDTGRERGPGADR